MLRKTFLTALCAAALIVLAPSEAARAARPYVLEGKVIHVADGDTITMLLDDRTQVKIRFSGIDAPEKGQAWGRKSRQSMSALAAGRRARAYVGKMDRYGRSVGVVTVDGQDVGIEQLRRGYAWAYTRYLHELPSGSRSLYLQAEQEARAARRGLWSDPDPVPPWEWRKARRAPR